MTDVQETQEAKPQTRALAPVRVNSLGLLQPANLTEAVEMAKLIAHSGMVPKQFEGSPGAVLVAIQMGAEIGLTPMASLQGIAVINGRPSLWGDALLAVVRGHPECEDVVEEIDAKTMTATCSVKRRGCSPVVRSFSQEDAKTAGLWGKGGPWSQYPRRMLAMRARGFALRDAFPDALRGVVSAEEAADIIDITPREPLQLGTQAFSKKGEQRVEAVARAAEMRLPDPGMTKVGEVVEKVVEAVAEKAKEPDVAPVPVPAQPPSKAKAALERAQLIDRIRKADLKELMAIEREHEGDAMILAAVGERIAKIEGEPQSDDDAPWNKHLPQGSRSK